MIRYVAMRRRPRADWDDIEAVQVAHTVYEPDPSPQETGLLDANGTPLYRIEEREPIGFDLGRTK